MKKSFKLIKLIAIVSGKFIPQGGFPGLMEVCQFLIGRTNEASIDIPPILNATKAEILKQHSWIGDIPVPKFEKYEEVELWYKGVLENYEETVEFTLPEKTISEEDIFSQTVSGLTEATGISPEKLQDSVKKVKKILNV